MINEAFESILQEQQNTIAELKAYIYDLREALEKIANAEVRTTHKIDKCPHGQYGYEECEQCIYNYAEQALATTPSQSLQEHDNEVIERCAKVCENIITGDDAEFYTDSFAKAIRALKGK